MFFLQDFSMEVEARSAQKTSVARAGTRLNKANCSEMSNRLALLELSWSKLTSGRSRALDKQQQVLHHVPYTSSYNLQCKCNSECTVYFFIKCSYIIFI